MSPVDLLLQALGAPNLEMLQRFWVLGGWHGRVWLQELSCPMAESPATLPWSFHFLGVGRGRKGPFSECVDVHLPSIQGARALKEAVMNDPARSSFSFGTSVPKQALTQGSSSSVLRGEACVPSALSFMAISWNQVSYIFIAWFRLMEVSHI